MKKTIAQQLGVTQFPFEIRDKRGKLIYRERETGSWEKWEWDSEGRGLYYEDSDSFWRKREYDDNGNEIYFENSYGKIIDNRPKPKAEPMTIEIDGKKYKLTEL